MGTIDESKWMWVEMESCKDESGFLLRKLDKVPLLGTDFRVRDVYAVSSHKLVRQRKVSDFEKQ